MKPGAFKRSRVEARRLSSVQGLKAGAVQALWVNWLQLVQPPASERSHLGTMTRASTSATGTAHSNPWMVLGRSG
jgi:hypothetical protein